MKNNKYAPYILGPILLLIWGLVFYKIYQAVYGGTDNISVPNFQTLPIYNGVAQDSAFALLLDYKDPFLGKNFVAEPRNDNASRASNHPVNHSPKTPIKPIIPIITTPTPQKPFPPIIYQGFQIMELDTIALLKIDGRFYPMVRERENIKGVEIHKIYADSIQLLFENQQKTFLKNRK